MIMSIASATRASGRRHAARGGSWRPGLGWLLRYMLVPLVASLIVLDDTDGGGAPPAARSVAAILVWWGLLMALAFSLGPRGRVRPAALACAGLMLALALQAGLSIAWAPSAERAFLEVARVLLYHRVLLLPVSIA